MTGKEVIKVLMKRDSISNIELAERTGVTQATLWARINNQNAKDLSLTVFANMVNAMGYEIIARKRDESGLLTEMPINIDGPAKPEGRGRPKKAGAD